MCPCARPGLTAEKRHYSPVDPAPIGERSSASDDFSRYCVQMLRMFPNATRGSVDERRAGPAEVL
jgi:hypothetical protein